MMAPSIRFPWLLYKRAVEIIEKKAKSVISGGNSMLVHLAYLYLTPDCRLTQSNRRLHEGGGGDHLRQPEGYVQSSLCKHKQRKTAGIQLERT